MTRLRPPKTLAKLKLSTRGREGEIRYEILLLRQQIRAVIESRGGHAREPEVSARVAALRAEVRVLREELAGVLKAR